ncbi:MULTISPECIES: monovalent cation/H(+) antiporter subunit G [Bacillaceae]|uniref:monovalent cation/H(+) antiporter subunit G n=1 Tax=Bacillaceae TaxID=186817 RepID=UPI001E4EFC30|nr:MULTISPECIES: monovalent cation/H(+) antiporter subunit G [Bacillaceae]MCE4050969.1 monovalent cation/H(+) antiporter subunit G [Bacillus sp. Au-Bac7]MCM3033973.1 monovalent cation/H(+) antiporter subunit G [Niallia sp. MER 6]UPO90076.1 monovalent cation/H(+) antiporter subunit G [Niallia sp. Man26]
MTEIVKVIVGLLIAIGVLLHLVAALGVIRLPDVYTRNHAASKASTLGIMVILLATFLYFYFINGHFNSRILLGIVFFFLTSPVAGHLIGRAAYNSGVELWDKSIQDDLKSSKDEKRLQK